MTTRSISIRALAALAFTLAALAAGCGGDDDGGDGATEGGGAATTQTQGGGAELAQGRELFVENCGSCHALEAAGTAGGIGPNLDELRPDEARVLNAIRTGPGPMPENLLQGEDARAVAQFVSQSAGR